MYDIIISSKLKVKLLKFYADYYDIMPIISSVDLEDKPLAYYTDYYYTHYYIIVILPHKILYATFDTRDIYYLDFSVLFETDKLISIKHCIYNSINIYLDGELSHRLHGKVLESWDKVQSDIIYDEDTAILTFNGETIHDFYPLYYDARKVIYKDENGDIVLWNEKGQYVIDSTCELSVCQIKRAIF